MTNIECDREDSAFMSVIIANYFGALVMMRRNSLVAETILACPPCRMIS